jgi:hypothetical protein
MTTTKKNIEISDRANEKNTLTMNELQSRGHHPSPVDRFHFATYWTERIIIVGKKKVHFNHSNAFDRFVERKNELLTLHWQSAGEFQVDRFHKTSRMPLDPLSTSLEMETFSLPFPVRFKCCRIRRRNASEF